MKRILLLKSTAAPSLAVQIAAAIPFGFKRPDLESFYGGHQVYIDQRGAGQQLGKWTETFLGHLVKGDCAYLYDLSILGTKIDLISERLTRIGVAGASICFTSTGKKLRLTAETIDLLLAMQDSRKAAGKRRMDHANAARRKKGIKVGSKPRWSAEDQDRCKAIWLTSSTQTEVSLRIKLEFGDRVGPHYSQVYRWANPPEGSKIAPWPPRGSGKVKPLPKPKRKRRKAKR